MNIVLLGFLISSCVFKSYFKQLFPQYFSIGSMATSWKYLPVLGTPTFNKTHSNSTHPGELVDCLKALVDRLGEEGSKLLVVENLKVTTWKKKDIKLDFLIEKKILNPALLFVINVRGFCTNLVGFCTQWQGANCSAGCSLDFEQRWHCHSDTLQIPPPQCSTASHLVLESIQKQVYLITQAADNMKPKYKKKKHTKNSYEVRGYVLTVWVPMCLRVSSTAELRFTLDNKPRQKRSELDGSVNPSTVREGWEAWKVSPTRWFSS